LIIGANNECGVFVKSICNWLRQEHLGLADRYNYNRPP
jgi:hypothetical protein